MWLQCNSLPVKPCLQLQMIWFEVWSASQECPLKWSEAGLPGQGQGRQCSPEPSTGFPKKPFTHLGHMRETSTISLMTRDEIRYRLKVRDPYSSQRCPAVWSLQYVHSPVRGSQMSAWPLHWQRLQLGKPHWPGWQSEHWRPVAPCLHWHWPVTGSHWWLKEPSELQSQAWREEVFKGLSSVILSITVCASYWNQKLNIYWIII